MFSPCFCGFVWDPGPRRARGSTAAAPGLRLHPGPSQGGCSLGWQGPPLALPPSRCFGLHRAVFTSWGASVRHRAFLAAPRDLRCSVLQPRGAMGMGKICWQQGCRHVASSLLCQRLRIPGSIPAGPAPVLAGPPSSAARTLSWWRCSGRRIFLALWWFSLTLRLTDEASRRRTWKQNFHSPWRSPAVTHARGLGGFTHALEEAEVSVKPL